MKGCRLRKLFEKCSENDSDPRYLLTYYFYLNERNTVETVRKLMEEVKKDFPEVPEENVHVDKAKGFPYEILLQFVIEEKPILSGLEKCPEDLMEL